VHHVLVISCIWVEWRVLLGAAEKILRIKKVQIERERMLNAGVGETSRGGSL
jgi:hypothetical protein